MQLGQHLTAARIKHFASGATLLVGALLLPLAVQSPHWRQILLLMVIYAGLTSGLNLLVGYAGLLDLGYVAFFAVGAYFTSIVTVRVAVEAVGPERYATHFWWLPYANVGPAIIASGVVAAFLGYPTLRARGDYLAIMTLGLGEIVRLIAINLKSVTEGPSGITAIPPFAFGKPLISPLVMYYITFAIIGLVLVLLWQLRYGHLVRVWRVIREDELSAESVGIYAPRYKLAAYVAGGMVAGVVGVVFAHTQGFVNPDSFALNLNFVLVALLILGGSGTWFGPIVGAVLWVGFEQYVVQTAFLQAHPELRYAILGTVVVIVLYLAPDGIVRMWKPGGGLRETKKAAKPEPAGGGVVTASDSKGSDVDHAHTAARHSDVVVAQERDETPRNPTVHKATRAPVGESDGKAETGVPMSLAAVNLTCRFGGLTAVRNASIAVTQGEILGLMGANGAGKTTLLNMLSGVQQPSDGSIQLDGKDVRLRRPSVAAAAGIARTFQMSRIIQDLSVIENVLIGAHRFLGHGPSVMLGVGGFDRGGKVGRERDRATALLDLVKLPRVADEPAGILPFGSQRRVEIARSLMTYPRFLLLDEPTAGTTPRERAELIELFEEIRSWGVGIVLIEHDMRLLMHVSDRVAAIDYGEVIATGAPGDVRRHPMVIRAYVGPKAGEFDEGAGAP